MNKRKILSTLLILTMVLTAIFSFYIVSYAGQGSGGPWIHLHITNFSGHDIDSVFIELEGEEEPIQMETHGNNNHYFTERGNRAKDDIKGFYINGKFYNNFTMNPGQGWGTINCWLTIGKIPVWDKGNLSIVNEITGDDPPLDTVFLFTVEGPEDFYEEFEITGNGNKEFKNVLTGNYVITVEPVDNFELQGDYSKTVTVAKCSTVETKFVYEYTAPVQDPETGSLEIEKVIIDKPTSDDVFTFDIIGPDYNETKSITGEDKVTIDDLIPGEYTITEIVLENYVPDDEEYLEGDYSKTAVVTAGGISTVTFTNKYISSDDPTEPEIWINKTVAEYDGTNIPDANTFVDRLELNKLDKKVIYKIEIGCNEEWQQLEKAVALEDLYMDDKDITNDLLVMEDDKLISVTDENAPINFSYPDYLFIDEESGLTLYYIDTLSKNGTYVNTATLYMDLEPVTLLTNDANRNVLGSDSATVVVTYKSSGGSSGNSDTNRVYYKANFPEDADTSGSVPVDSTRYSDGKTVTVKDITTLSAEGYKFDGWNTKADGLGTDYDAGDTLKIYNDITLYAQWKAQNDGDDDGDDGETVVTTVDTDPLDPPKPDVFDDVPKTGDNAPLLPMALLALLSAGTITFFVRRRFN